MSSLLPENIQPIAPDQFNQLHLPQWHLVLRLALVVIALTYAFFVPARLVLVPYAVFTLGMTVYAAAQSLLTDEEVWSSDQAAATRALPSGLCITQREREVILGLICYRRLTRVAEVLGISVHTGRNHLKSVFRKLNLHSQDELLEFLLNENQP